MTDRQGLSIGAFALLLLALVSLCLSGSSITEGPKLRQAQSRLRAVATGPERASGPDLPDLRPRSPLRKWKGIRIEEAVPAERTHFLVRSGVIRVGEAWTNQALVASENGAEAYVIVSGEAGPLREWICRALAEPPFRLRVLEEQR